MIALSVNGKSYEVDVETDTPLLWVLRDTIGLTGTKYGCGIAQCGACTVHIDGVATRSCQVPVGTVGGKTVGTIEALAHSGKLHTVQQAWLDLDVPQCGYCQSGMIMTVVALLKEKSATLSKIMRSGVDTSTSGFQLSGLRRRPPSW
jgi:isoquinoline 1-oxidoreductase subunit alpha